MQPGTIEQPALVTDVLRVAMKERAGKPSQPSVSASLTQTVSPTVRANETADSPGAPAPSTKVHANNPVQRPAPSLGSRRDDNQWARELRPESSRADHPKTSAIADQQRGKVVKPRSTEEEQESSRREMLDQILRRFRVKSKHYAALSPREKAAFDKSIEMPIEDIVRSNALIRREGDDVLTSASVFAEEILSRLDTSPVGRSLLRAIATELSDPQPHPKVGWKKRPQQASDASSILDHEIGRKPKGVSR